MKGGRGKGSNWHLPPPTSAKTILKKPSLISVKRKLQFFYVVLVNTRPNLIDVNLLETIHWISLGTCTIHWISLGTGAIHWISLGTDTIHWISLGTGRLFWTFRLDQETLCWEKQASNHPKSRRVNKILTKILHSKHIGQKLHTLFLSWCFLKQCEHFKQSEHFKQFEHFKQSEHFKQFEHFKQSEHFKQFELFEQSEHFKQSEKSGSLCDWFFYQIQGTIQ